MTRSERNLRVSVILTSHVCCGFSPEHVCTKAWTGPLLRERLIFFPICVFYELRLLFLLSKCYENCYIKPSFYFDASLAISLMKFYFPQSLKIERSSLFFWQCSAKWNYCLHRMAWRLRWVTNKPRCYKYAFEFSCRIFLPAGTVLAKSVICE